MIFFTLLIVILSDGGVSSISREFPTEEACNQAQLIAHDAATRAIGVLDIGTICVRSVLDPNKKPHA